MSADACRRCAASIEPGDLRCPVCAMAVPAPASAPPLGQKIVRCTECAAAVAFSAEHGAPHCSFCGAVAQVEQPQDPLEQAEQQVPFLVTRDEAEHALRGWLARRRWLSPRDLSSAATVAKLEALSWAGWVVKARGLVSWAADSDHGAGRSSWAPHSGQTQIDFDNILVSASRGLTGAEVAALTPGYDLATARPVTGSEAWVVEEFDAQRSAARKTVLAALETTAAHSVQQGTIPGRRFRNVKVGVMLRGFDTQRMALPAWVLAYRYAGRLHRAVINGQRASIIVGKPPRSRAKIALLVAAIVLVVALGALLLARA